MDENDNGYDNGGDSEDDDDNRGHKKSSSLSKSCVTLWLFAWYITFLYSISDS